MTVDRLSRGLKNEVSIQPQLVNQMGFLSKDVNYASRIERVSKAPEPDPLDPLETLYINLKWEEPLVAYSPGRGKIKGLLVDIDYENRRLTLKDPNTDELNDVDAYDSEFFIPTSILDFPSMYSAENLDVEDIGLEPLYAKVPLKQNHS